MENLVLVMLVVMTATTMLSTGSLFVASSSETEKAIFLLAGQSNMVGIGGVDNETKVWDGYIPPECQADPRILRLNTEALWEEAHEPLHLNITSKDNCLNNGDKIGVGPGMPFANTLLKRDPAIGTIGLVPSALAGSELSQWARGTCLYNTLLTRAQAALKEGGSLRAMLWYQGESDCATEALVAAYEQKLRTFFNDFRSDVMSPSLPIIQVALANGFGAKIRSIQLNFNMSNVRCVDAKGLAINPDNLHLTTESQVKLGSMLAEAFLAYFNSTT